MAKAKMRGRRINHKCLKCDMDYPRMYYYCPWCGKKNKECTLKKGKEQ